MLWRSSRDGCEQIATLINRELKRRRTDPDIALAYHAGFGTEDRAERMRRNPGRFVGGSGGGGVGSVLGERGVGGDDGQRESAGQHALEKNTHKERSSFHVGFRLMVCFRYQVDMLT